MPRQERGMDVQASVRRQIQNSFGENFAVGRHHDHVGSGSREFRHHGFLAQGARLCDREIVFRSRELHRGHVALPPPPGGTVLLRNDKDYVVALCEGVQAGYGKGGSTAEDDTHCVSLRIFCWRVRLGLRFNAAELFGIFQVVQEERAVQVIDLMLEHPRQKVCGANAYLFPFQ